MYVVRSRKGNPVARFKTKHEAEVFVRIRSAASPVKKLTPLSVAQADVATGRFSTLRVQQLNGYWYVGRMVEQPLYRDRSEGPQALVFEDIVGPFASRGYAEKIRERAIKRAEKASRSPHEPFEARATREHKEALLKRTQRARATYQRRASNAPETFRAVAVDHRGHVLGSWVGPSVQGLMATVDHALPLEKTFSVTIRGEYTSDGTWHADHGGRIVAGREPGPNRGRGGWISY